MTTPNLHPSRTKPDSMPRAPVPILILDDERVDRYRMARLCSGLGFPCQVSNAKTLAEFSEVLEKDQYDLVLVDYSLPDGSGMDALEMLRLSPRNLNAVSLMVTGMQTRELSERAFAAGCAGFLSKDDLTPDRFARAVGDVLGSTLFEPKARKTYSVDEVEQLLSLCAIRSARATKSSVSRLMRQIRELRGADGQDVSGVLQQLEQDCMALWHVLIARERDAGPHHLADILAEGSFQEGVQDKPKPPSPFGGKRH